MDSTKNKFGFGNETLNKGVAEEKEIAQQKSVEIVEEQEDLTQEYTDKRSVTIALVKNYSLYRRANDKALLPRRDFIGSSITSSTGSATASTT